MNNLLDESLLAHGSVGATESGSMRIQNGPSVFLEVPKLIYFYEFLCLGFPVISTFKDVECYGCGCRAYMEFPIVGIVILLKVCMISEEFNSVFLDSVHYINLASESILYYLLNMFQCWRTFNSYSVAII